MELELFAQDLLLACDKHGFLLSERHRIRRRSHHDHGDPLNDSLFEAY